MSLQQRTQVRENRRAIKQGRKPKKIHSLNALFIRKRFRIV